MITLLVAGFYALVRLLMVWRRLAAAPAAALAGWLLAMVVVGLALGAVQFVPLYELVSTSFRQGSASYDEVVGWAWPSRQIITFLLPDFFGNPSHHGWWDPWLRAWRWPGPTPGPAGARRLLGRQELRRGRQLPGHHDLVLAVVAVVGAVASWGQVQVRGAGEVESGKGAK